MVLTSLTCLALLNLPVANDLFKVVLLPDTQHYSELASLIYQFDAQTQWIADNKDLENIVFATLVGDIVQNGAKPPNANQAEWDRAVGAMDRLDGNLAVQPEGLIPYATCPGNHDYDVVNQKGALTQYLTHFGNARYAGRSWFLGSNGASGASAQLFPAGNGSLLHIGLDWLPNDSSIVWAQGLLAAHPNTPAIVSTHQHLIPSNPPRRSLQGATPSGGGSNSGEDLYRKLVEPFPQVFLVLSGHFPGDARIESTTAMGFPALEIVADYQLDPNGGNGWMQVLNFSTDEAVLFLRTLSPTYVPGVTPGPNRALSPASNYSVTLDLDQLVQELGTSTTLRFRQGQDFGEGHYADAVDTYVGSGLQGMTLPGTPYGAAKNLVVDANQDQEQSLLRFGNIVGAGPGQIPPGSTVLKAVLTLTTEGEESAYSDQGGSLHRALTSWDESSTWNSLGSGIQLGSEAEPIADVSTHGRVDKAGTDSFDVTASVQAWVDGQANLGWAILANGYDEWSVRSSDWTSVAERPLLTVRISAPTPAVTYCTAGTSANGCNALLSASGIPSATATSGFTIHATGVEGSPPGVFYIGVNGRQANPWGNGTSFQCVVPPVWRGGLINGTGTPGQCDGSFAQDWNALWCATCPKPSSNPGAGTVTQGQLWYRDAFNTSNQTTSLSNAIEFTVMP